MSNEERYRSLFEGSQASLSDMAARQAQALARVGRLRNALVTVLRKNFLALSVEAEANLGARLSDVDDEILLAYLDAFTTAAARGDQRATLQALAEAIRAAGIPLQGDEPLSWVEQIHQHRRNGSTTSHAVPVVAKEVVTALPPLITPPSSEVRPVDDYWQPAVPRQTPTPAAEPAASDRDAALNSLFADVPAPLLWANALGSVEDDSDQWTPSPVRPRDHGETAQLDKAVGTTEQAAVTAGSTRPAAEAPGAGRHDEHDEHANHANDTADLASVFATTGAAAPTTTATVEPKRRARKTATPPAGKGSDGPVVSAPSANSALATGQPERNAEEVPPTIHATATPAAIETSTAADPAEHGGGAGLTLPLRPELIPTTTRKKTRATKKATRPTNYTEPTLLSVVDESARDLDDGMRSALLAAASIPRPVFARDLVAIAGSLETVDAWEAECRSNVNTSPVRFVAPKSRHRLRGCLVAVEQTETRPADWWNQAVKRYRAGRLYELGVLLHRVGDEVVSFNLEDRVAVFRLNTPRGLMGIVVVLDAHGVDGGVLVDVASHVGSLLSERLTMVAVLTTSAEPGSLEALCEGLDRLVRKENWAVTMPIVAARSWEYADDRGTSAVLISGQV